MTVVIILACAAALVALAGFAIKLGQDSAKQAGRDEILKADAEAEAFAQRKINEIATQGQTNAETLKDLQSGDF